MNQFTKNHEEATRQINEFFEENEKVRYFSLSDLELYIAIKEICDFIDAFNNVYKMQKLCGAENLLITDEMIKDFYNRLYNLVFTQISQIVYTRYRDFNLSEVSDYDITRQEFKKIFENDPNFNFKILDSDSIQNKCFKFLVGSILYMTRKLNQQNGIK